MIEAIVALDNVAQMEELYYLEKDKYTDDINVLGLALKPSLRYYTITITVPARSNPQSFEATASGDIDKDSDIDVWTINQYRNLIHTTID